MPQVTTLARSESLRHSPLFQYGLLSHHELLYPNGKRGLDYESLELDVEMMLSTVDY